MNNEIIQKILQKEKELLQREEYGPLRSSVNFARQLSKNKLGLKEAKTFIDTFADISGIDRKEYMVKLRDKFVKLAATNAVYEEIAMESKRLVDRRNAEKMQLALAYHEDCAKKKKTLNVDLMYPNVVLDDVGLPVDWDTLPNETAFQYFKHKQCEIQKYICYSPVGHEKLKKNLKEKKAVFSTLCPEVDTYTSEYYNEMPDLNQETDDLDPAVGTMAAFAYSQMEEDARYAKITD